MSKKHNQAAQRKQAQPEQQPAPFVPAVTEAVKATEAAVEQAMAVAPIVETAAGTPAEAPKVEMIQGAETITPVVEGLTAEDALKKTAPELIALYGNKSNAIRGLNGLGIKTGPISKAMGIRYQHARNVLSKPLKRVIRDVKEAANHQGQVAAPASEAPVVTA